MYVVIIYECLQNLVHNQGFNLNLDESRRLLLELSYFLPMYLIDLGIYLWGFREHSPLPHTSASRQKFNMYFTQVSIFRHINLIHVT